MKRIIALLFTIAAFTQPVQAAIVQITVKDAGGVTRNFSVTTNTDISGNLLWNNVICDPATSTQCAAVSAGGALKIDGSAVTQPVSGTITVTGVATSANQSTEITALQAIQTSAATTATNTAAAIPTQAPTVSIGGVGIIDSGGTNVATVKAASTASVAADKSLVGQLNPAQPAIVLWGHGATAATTPTSATAVGCNGVNAFPTAVTNGQMTVPVCDLDSTQINRPWAPKARWVSGVTAAMTGTTSTQLIAAVTSNKIYLTSITCGNSHATVGTFVNVQDGSGGTTLWTLPAAITYGGAVNNIVPPVATTAGNGVFVVDATTGANVICSGSGYSGP